MVVFGMQEATVLVLAAQESVALSDCGPVSRDNRGVCFLTILVLVDYAVREGHPATVVCPRLTVYCRPEVLGVDVVEGNVNPVALAVARR